MLTARRDPLTPRQIIVDQPFDLADILDGTQDFRWLLMQDGWYSGVLSGNLVHLRQAGGFLEYRAEEDLADLLRRYFRLDDDLIRQRAELAAVDGRIAELARKHRYLRVLDDLRQPDTWECVVAYICSANNSVARIGKIVEMMAGQLGHPVNLGSDVRQCYSAP